ncbi:hypothetical protein BJX61DRAFT_101431 [Aspergillus egyptiacus]|nr:hypothetical protein BJX61DRAFT_101431 [Aspergillus egyptiacus]
MEEASAEESILARLGIVPSNHLNALPNVGSSIIPAFSWRALDSGNAGTQKAEKVSPLKHPPPFPYYRRLKSTFPPELPSRHITLVPRMGLSPEAIIALASLFVACIPGMWYIVDGWHRWRNRHATGAGNTLLPVSGRAHHHSSQLILLNAVSPEPNPQSDPHACNTQPIARSTRVYPIEPPPHNQINPAERDHKHLWHGLARRHTTPNSLPVHPRLETESVYYSRTLVAGCSDDENRLVMAQR